MASLDKLPGVVKELEDQATDYDTFEAFEANVRALAVKAYNGQDTGLSDDPHEELCNLAADYNNEADFQNELARYAELAWGHARGAADPGPQPNAHLTGTPAHGDVMAGNPDVAPWAQPVGGEEVSEAGVDTPVKTYE